MWCFDYEKGKKGWVGEIGQVAEKGYKYLGVLDICQGYKYREEMKENIRKEYFKRLRATIEIKFKCKACIPSNVHMGGANFSIRCCHY